MNWWGLIKADQARYVEHNEFSNSSVYLILNAFLCKNHRLAFQFWLRLLTSKPNIILRSIAKIMHLRLSRKYGLQIPVGVQIGPGLYIGHGIGIVINKKTKIGSNCNISHFLTIGSNKGTPATIGDRVYIGPGVSIVEDVKIGNDVKIGAGTVVVYDIPDRATSVGNPNRIVK